MSITSRCEAYGLHEPRLIILEKIVKAAREPDVPMIITVIIFQMSKFMGSCLNYLNCLNIGLSGIFFGYSSLIFSNADLEI